MADWFFLSAWEKVQAEKAFGVLCVIADLKLQLAHPQKQNLVAVFKKKMRQDEEEKNDF